MLRTFAACTSSALGRTRARGCGPLIGLHGELERVAAQVIRLERQRFVEDAARRHAKRLPVEISNVGPEHVEAWFNGKLSRSDVNAAMMETGSR